MQNCIEEKSGYRVNFGFQEPRALLQDLLDGGVELGLLGLTSLQENTPELLPVLSVDTLQEERSLVIARDDTWRKLAHTNGYSIAPEGAPLGDAAHLMDNDLFLFLAPHSFEGHLLPQKSLLDIHAWPPQVSFETDSNAVLARLEAGEALAGVVLLSEARTLWGNVHLRVGSVVGPWRILALSDPLPGPQWLSPAAPGGQARREVLRMLPSLVECAQKLPEAARVLFGGSKMSPWQTKRYQALLDLWKNTQTSGHDTENPPENTPHPPLPSPSEPASNP